MVPYCHKPEWFAQSVFGVLCVCGLFGCRIDKTPVIIEVWAGGAQTSHNDGCGPLNREISTFAVASYNHSHSMEHNCSDHLWKMMFPTAMALRPCTNKIVKMIGKHRKTKHVKLGTFRKYCRIPNPSLNIRIALLTNFSHCVIDGANCLRHEFQILEFRSCVIQCICKNSFVLFTTQLRKLLWNYW